MTESTQSVLVTLTGIGEFGETVGENEGERICVSGGIPGEVVEAEIIRRTDDGVNAITTNVIEASPHRHAPVCPHFGECSGCQWQHINYDHQVTLKSYLVRRALESEGLDSSIVREVLPSSSEFGYRNHARLSGKHRQ